MFYYKIVLISITEETLYCVEKLFIGQFRRLEIDARKFNWLLTDNIGLFRFKNNITTYFITFISPLLLNLQNLPHKFSRKNGKVFIFKDLLSIKKEDPYFRNLRYQYLWSNVRGASRLSSANKICLIDTGIC